MFSIPALPLPVVLIACLAMAAFVLRNRYKAWIGQARTDLSSGRGHYPPSSEISASDRFEGFLDAVKSRNDDSEEAELLVLTMGRALVRACLAAVFALLLARLLTSEKLLGIYWIIEPEFVPSEVLPRVAYVVLLFPALVAIAPMLERWLSGGDGAPAGMLRKAMQSFASWAPALAIYLPLATSGMTAATVLAVGAVLAALYILALPSVRKSAENSIVPLAQGLVSLGLAFVAFAVMAVLALMGSANSGTVSLLLIFGLAVPLLTAPAFWIPLTAINWITERRLTGGKEELGLGLILLVLIAALVAALTALAIGLALGVGLGSLIGPAPFRPGFGAILSGLWSDPAMGGPFWIIAAAVVFPVLAFVVEALVCQLVPNGSAYARLVRLLEARASLDRLTHALVRARLVGWGKALLLTGLPVLLAGWLIFRPWSALGPA